MREEIHAIVSGRVQMVMYRDFAQRKARALGLAGTVRNLKDGTVEVIAQGEPHKLRQFIAKLHEGSVLARVEGVSVDWRSSNEQYDDFSIIY